MRKRAHKNISVYLIKKGVGFGLNVAAMRVIGREPHPHNNGNAMPCSTGRLRQGWVHEFYKVKLNLLT